MTDTSIENEIVALENERCRALVDGDIDTLERLVADDVVHVHANGKADDKRAYLQMIQSQLRFIEAARSALSVRVYHDVAVATGPLRQTIEMNATGHRLDMYIMTTQVWRQQDGKWRQVSFQATNL
ncbi:Nuclear transport factor 2 family protein [Pararobbsia alpina]|uniref:nuclear transport factor 2 family protein n=1 Tax=Pararobbsia alpina TaxID=621374 RepID=UPI0039A5747A